MSASRSPPPIPSSYLTANSIAPIRRKYAESSGWRTPVPMRAVRAVRLEQSAVEMASDGQGALFSLARRTVDAIVLDVLMPVMDGLETCRRLRRQGNHTPVLILTA